MTLAAPTRCSPGSWTHDFCHFRPCGKRAFTQGKETGLHTKYWLIALIIVLWSIKFFVGYYIFSWVTRRVKPWWYWLRGVRKSAQGEVDLQALLKAMSFAEKNPGKLLGTKSLVTVANAKVPPSAVVEVLYGTGAVRDTVTLSAAVLCLTDSPVETLRGDFGEAIANLVNDWRSQCAAPTPTPSPSPSSSAAGAAGGVSNGGTQPSSPVALPRASTLEAQEIQLGIVIAALAYQPSSLSSEDRAELIARATAQRHALRGTHLELEALLDAALAKARTPPSV